MSHATITTGQDTNDELGAYSLRTRPRTKGVRDCELKATAATALSPEEHRSVLEALAILQRRVTRGPLVESPEATRQWLKLEYGFLAYEMFGLLLLDNRHRLIVHKQLFRGTVDSSSVHPREVLRVALAYGAAAVILVHNHPSGVAEPSQADELITRRLREALGLVDVRVLDHLIVGGDNVVSFAERGLL